MQPAAATTVLALGPPPARGEARQDRGRRQRCRADRRVPRREEARLMAGTLVFLEHHEGVDPEGLARRAGEGCAARRRGERRADRFGRARDRRVGRQVRCRDRLRRRRRASRRAAAADAHRRAREADARRGVRHGAVRAVGARRRRGGGTRRAPGGRAQLGSRRSERRRRRQASCARGLRDRGCRLVERREARDLPLRHVRRERDRRHGRREGRSGRARGFLDPGSRWSSRLTRSSKARRSKRPT